jgi:uncharacterized protein YjbI with pentapeptide repeats
VPVRRGMLVVPDDSGSIIQRGTADLTSGSLQKGNRRGVPVTPAEMRWIIKRNSADLTSGSLQADATSASLRSADLTSGSLQGAH